jgi:hypothetical protein
MNWYPTEPKPPTKPGGPWVSVIIDARTGDELPTGVAATKQPDETADTPS